MEQNEKEQSSGQPARGLSSYAKYTGVAFQMMAIIGVFAYIGYKIDEANNHSPQWVTAISCVIGVCVSIYQTIRSLKS